MKYLIEIIGTLELPAVQEISAADFTELQDNSSEISQLDVLDFGEEILMQGSVFGIRVCANYSIHLEGEGGYRILIESELNKVTRPVFLNYKNRHFYRYDYRVGGGGVSFQVECEKFEEQKLVLCVSEVSLPKEELFPEGNLRVITGIEYDGEVIEGDSDWGDYPDICNGIFTVNECGELISLNDTKIDKGGGADGEKVV
jgi:hypothetical protein